MKKLCSADNAAQIECATLGPMPLTVIFKCVCTTNLIYAPEELKTREWYLQANMVPYIGRIIDALNTDESIYDLIHSTSRLQDLASQMKISDLIDEDDTETI